MKHSFLDRYSHLDSPVHRLDPRIKIIAALLAIIIITSESLSGRLVHFAVYSVLVIVIAGISRIPIKYLMNRILILSPFILMAALFYPVSQLQLREVSLTSDWRSLAETGLSVFLKAFLALLILLLLSSTEKFHSLLRALRWLKIPVIVTTLSALLYRYIFLLADERLKTARARESRTPGVLRTNRIKIYGNQAAVIFLRSWERSQLIYKSMLSRGFAGEFPETEEMKLRGPDIIFSFLFIGLLLLTRLIT